MSTRISSAVSALILLAACSETIPTKAENAQAVEKVKAHATAASRIPCALGGAAVFSPACAIDRQQTQDGLILVVRHPDGEFHRLKVTNDGRGVIAADGAETAKVTVLAADKIEVAIAGARYHLPATVAPARK